MSFSLLARSLHVFLAIALGLLLRAALAGAQTTSTITGRVLDSDGGVLPGAIVTVRHVETSLSRSTATDRAGRYVFPLLPVGAWEVRAEMPGFKPLVRKGIEVTIAETAIVDFSLQVGGLTEEVTVSADVSDRAEARWFEVPFRRALMVAPVPPTR